MISIIVPIYNAEKYLDKCLNSIINQTYKNIEIICVDDGSTDDSLKICQKYGEKDERIKVIHKKNEGVTASRKLGVKIANGKWIGFVDADDWIEPHMYENLVKKAISYNVPLVCANYRRCYEDYCVKNEMNFNEGIYDISENNSKFASLFIINTDTFDYGISPSIWDKLFDKDKIYTILKELNDEIVFAEDATIVYSYILKYKKIFILNKIVYNYRLSNNNSCIHNFDEKKIKNIEMSIKFIERYLRKNQNYDCNIRQLFFLKIFYYILYCPQKLENDLGDNILSLFGGISKKERIVLYGAGVMGIKYYNYFLEKGINICLWVDKRWKELDYNNLSPVERIYSENFDKIIIASIKNNVIKNIKEELEQNGIDREKIRYINFNGSINNIYEKQKKD